MVVPLKEKNPIRDSASQISKPRNSACVSKQSHSNMVLAKIQNKITAVLADMLKIETN